MSLEGRRGGARLAPIAFAAGSSRGLRGSVRARHHSARHVFVPLPYALAVFAVVDFANGLRLGLENPRNAVLGDIARMVPLMIAGIVTGTTLLVNLPRNASLVALGAFVLCYAIYSLSRRGLRRRPAATGRFLAGFCAVSRNALRGEGRLTRSISRTP